VKTSFADDDSNDWSDAARPHAYGSADSPVSQHVATGNADPSDVYDAPPSEQSPVADPEINLLLGKDDDGQPEKRVLCS
jgi:hypothetical protein